ncbi:hypothetical protein Trydic_g23190 [Trypoxylus dichotomus]
MSLLDKHVSYLQKQPSSRVETSNGVSPDMTEISQESENLLPEHNTLRDNNVEISKYITLLKEQREELAILIEKQETEKKQLKTEMDRLKYKYRLVTKSLNQRLMTQARYDQTIQEAEELFKKIVVSSNTLLGAVRKDVDALEETINKKVGTDISTLATMKKPIISNVTRSASHPPDRIIRSQHYPIPSQQQYDPGLPSAMDCNPRKKTLTLHNHK